MLVVAVTQALAIPVPAPPIGERRRDVPTPPPLPPPAGSTLPEGSTLYFVLDEKINSGSTKPGTHVPMHLRDALVLNGRTVVPAGAPATLDVVTTSKAGSGDVDGAVQIYLEPFAIPGQGLDLPLHAFHEYLTVGRTAGELATRSTTDQVADIFIPYHAIYQIFRPGRQLVLPTGSVLRAQVAATLDASNPAKLAIETPAPFASNFDQPHSDLTPSPLYTPAPATPRPLPKGRSTLPPRPQSSAAPTPSGAPSPSAASASTSPTSAASTPTAAPASPSSAGASGSPASAAPQSPSPGPTTTSSP